MTLGRDRLLMLLAAAVGAVLFSISAILQEDVRFLVLLAILLYVLVLGFSLTARTKKLFWGIIAAGVLVVGVGGAVYYRDSIRLSLDPDYRAVRLVFDLLEGCTRPAPDLDDMQVERQAIEGTTHLVTSLSGQYDYGNWRVNVESEEVYAIDDGARFLVEENRCRARTFLPG